MQNIRSKLTELSNEGITTAQRDILKDDFDQLLSQAANFIDNAVFNGVNLLDTAGASPDVNTLSNLDGGTLTLSGQDLRTTINSLARSEEHTSELQSLMRISYAVFCLKKKT